MSVSTIISCALSAYRASAYRAHIVRLACQFQIRQETRQETRYFFYSALFYCVRPRGASARRPRRRLQHTAASSDSYFCVVLD